MSENLDYTMKFEHKVDAKMTEEEVIDYVYDALDDKGYNPVNQLVGYFLSGDPSYITGYKNARGIIKQYERDELLEYVMKQYLFTKEK